MIIAEQVNWEKYHQKRIHREEIPANPRTIRAIRSAMDVRNKKILEVGSETGRDSIYLAKLGADCVLLDYVDASLETARRIADRQGVKVQTIQADARSMPFEDGFFDLVYSQGLLEHYADPLPLLKEQIRVLKKGGFLLADVPQKYHIYTVVKHILMLFGRWTPNWETQYSIVELEKLVKKTGLDITSTYGDWSHPPFLLKAVMIAFNIPYKTNGIKPILNSNGFFAGLRKTRFAHYTFQHIGVIAKK